MSNIDMFCPTLKQNLFEKEGVLDFVYIMGIDWKLCSMIEHV